jgi:hypothetical protein
LSFVPLGRPVRPTPTSRLAAPFRWLDWCCQWLAYWAGNLAVFRVLEYAGKLTVLVALIFWIAEIPDRRKAAIQTAWTVVTSKGGGRKEALQYLISEKVDLDGLNGENGYFEGISMKGLQAHWSNIQDADFSNADLEGTDFEGSKIIATKFLKSNLTNANFRNTWVHVSDPITQFDGATIDGADFRGVLFSGEKDIKKFLSSIHAASGWQNALFDDEIRKQLLVYATSPPASSPQNSNPKEPSPNAK